MSIGKKLKILRKNAGMTQQSLADIADVSRIYIQALESDRRVPSMKLLRRLADILNSSVTDIVDEFPKNASSIYLEEIFSYSDVDVWFRQKKLTVGQLRMVERVIAAILDEENAGAPRMKRGYIRRKNKEKAD
ncbi:MAG: helix-turn-helix domain-containing protein [Synergistaceae bacterium]|jgi:transcriptional regulator with XRE-family HTH domain|nr:helix-turn-helix domain-containing protein [Synergistaceae bacterium]